MCSAISKSFLPQIITVLSCITCHIIMWCSYHYSISLVWASLANDVCYVTCYISLNLGCPSTVIGTCPTYVRIMFYLVCYYSILTGIWILSHWLEPVIWVSGLCLMRLLAHSSLRLWNPLHNNWLCYIHIMITTLS